MHRARYKLVRRTEDIEIDLDLDSELLFVGDAGSTEPSRASRRHGLEFANHWRPLSWLTVDADLTFAWQILEGTGSIDRPHDQAVTYHAPAEPGLTRIRVTVQQREIVREAEALVTVTHELLPQLGTASVEAQGLPGYTFERAPGE